MESRDVEHAAMGRLSVERLGVERLGVEWVGVEQLRLDVEVAGGPGRAIS